MKSGWKVWAQWSPVQADYEMVLIREDVDGTRAVVTDIQFEKIDRHGLATKQPQLFGCGESEDFLRAVMDAAWENGIRPTGFKDHTKELTAVRYHLEDMRLLAKVKKPDG